MGRKAFYWLVTNLPFGKKIAVWEVKRSSLRCWEIGPAVWHPFGGRGCRVYPNGSIEPIYGAD